MEYSAQELWGVAGKLADKYTSKESTSVSYEKAQMLMEAVLYCIREYEEGRGQAEALAVPGAAVPAEEVCRLGRQIVMDKVREAKKEYELLLKEFDDYGCRNYHDTVIKGMPVFFTKYDPYFSPQDHLLMLDYPLLSQNMDLCGVDLILSYLRNIRQENAFMRCFDREAVISLLRQIQEEYEEHFFDNLCTQVLYAAVGCMITDRPLEELRLDEKDRLVAAAYFEGGTKEKRNWKFRRFVHALTDRMEGVTDKLYFEQCQFPVYYFRPAVEKQSGNSEKADSIIDID